MLSRFFKISLSHLNHSCFKAYFGVGRSSGFLSSIHDTKSLHWCVVCCRYFFIYLKSQVMFDRRSISGVLPEKRKHPVNRLKNTDPKLNMSAL
jgi:hypothetical protein